MMESYTNEQQAALEKAIKKFLDENRELVLRRIVALQGIDIIANPGRDINLRTSGLGRAYYNDVEIGSGGGGGVTTFQGRDGNVVTQASDYDDWYLSLSGGVMYGPISFIEGQAGAIILNRCTITGFAANRDWDTDVYPDWGICKSDIAGSSGLFTKDLNIYGNMDFEIGMLQLPRGNNVPANCSLGDMYWESDAFKLWVGKGTNQWERIYHIELTGRIYLNEAKTAWMIMNGNVLEFHIPNSGTAQNPVGKWRVVPE